MTDEQKPPKKRHLALIVITVIFTLLFALFFALWFFDWRFEVSTEDAYVQGNMVVVTPQVPGYVTAVTVDDTEVVEEGRILVTLDRTDQKLAFESAKNALAETVRNVAGLYERVGVLRGELEMRKAEFAKAAQDYKHRKGVVKEGGVSREDFEHSEAAFISAFALMLSTQHALREALTQTENTTVETHPLIKKEIDRVKETYVNLRRCVIRSPVRGMVVMKKVQVGESVQPESPLLTVIPLDQIWVNANYKENKLRKVRIGQKATFTTDIYGRDVVYHGEVIGISAGTGSVLSVLPPQNATGNWIKIVQRLPVRIKLDPEELAQNPLRLGLSTYMRIDIRDSHGKRIPPPAPPGALYSTKIFNKQEKGVGPIIEKIIKDNSTFSFKDEQQQ